MITRKRQSDRILAKLVQTDPGQYKTIELTPKWTPHLSSFIMIVSHFWRISWVLWSGLMFSESFPWTQLFHWFEDKHESDLVIGWNLWTDGCLLYRGWINGALIKSNLLEKEFSKSDFMLADTEKSLPMYNCQGNSLQLNIIYCTKY